MSKPKKGIITDKHVEAIAGQTIKLIFTIFGNFQANISGSVTARLRNRFKQFVFVPTFPFMSLAFAAHDVQSIEVTDDGIVVTLGQEEEKPKRRKKKKALPVVAPEPEPEIDLNKKPSNASNGSYMVPGLILLPPPLPST
jgi:hypothetical protein